MAEDAIIPVVEHIVNSNYKNLKEDIIQESKKRVVDTFGALVASSNTRETIILGEYIDEIEGQKTCTVFNLNKKTIVTEAAMANATMARVMDLDDVFELTSTHIHVSIVPTAMALAEMLGNITGKEFLHSIILGADLIARLSLANNIPTAISGMNATYQLGTFGCTATAGKLLKLNKEQMLNAMGIAYAHLAGNSQCLVEGAMTTRLSGGLSAKNGISSAILSKKGFTGVKEILEGKFGYFKLYQKNDYNRDILLEDLGKIYWNIKSTIKKYSCCMHTHAAIIALENILKEFNLCGEMISRVNVKVNQQAYNLVCLGENQKRNPKSIPEAQFSMAYVLGTILQQKSLSLKDFTDRKIKSKKRLKYCSLIHSSVSDEIDKNTGKQISPALVEVFLKDGSRHEKYVDRRKGHPDNPLSMEELKEKFKNCLSFRGKMKKESVQDAIFTKIMNLEKYNPIRIATLLKN